MTQLLRIASLAVLLEITVGSVVADDPSKIEGRWQVVSVELAGTPVPGLEAAELVLSGGQKVFTLPGGRIEKGTYQLDAAKQPCEIDATTDGKGETEKGIYDVNGETLKLCFAAGVGERPRTFATRKSTDQLLIVFRRVVDESEGKPAADKLWPAKLSTDKTSTGKTSTGKPSTENSVADKPSDPNRLRARRFRMGFTGFVYDTTLEAVMDSRKFVRENGDIMAHQFEGTPWAEALGDQPFPKAMLDEWEGKKSATPLQGQVYLAISPGRGDLKVAEKASSLPKELAGKEYDDPMVMRAYLNYCRRAIEFFHPDYLAIGIEVNEIHDAGPRKWQAYVALHTYIYEQLKKDHQDLPIFASWTLHNMFKKRGQMLEEYRQLMPYNDLVAVSYYPFFVEDEDRLAALDWMTSQFDSFNKPYAIVETNDAAERLPLPQAQVVIEGTIEKQETYYRKLLQLAQQRDFAFVISFVHQDYDALWETIKDQSPELFIAWRDCGLLDEKGKSRPAFEVWKSYFEAPLEK
jgi:uncharacterized protein (TIGR03067 family)